MVCVCAYLDDADGDGLAHVAHGEAPQRRELLEGLHAQRLGGHQRHDGRVARLDRLRLHLGGLACRYIFIIFIFKSTTLNVYLIH